MVVVGGMRRGGVAVGTVPAGLLLLLLRLLLLRLLLRLRRRLGIKRRRRPWGLLGRGAGVGRVAGAVHRWPRAVTPGG